jgi:hypothetical protein
MLPEARSGADCRVIRILSPVSADKVADTVAAESGFFAFENLNAGKYLLVTFGNRGLCSVYETEVGTEHEQQLVLQPLARSPRPTNP